MNSTIDLHIHTTASDGLHTPTEIVDMAARKGLRVISITDHDTMAGIDEAIAAAEGTPLQVIPGVELSTDDETTEVHLLGYFVDQASEELASTLARFRESRLERAEKMVGKLRTLGVRLSWERLMELSEGGAMGRPHLAMALHEAGAVGSIQEAFDRYLGRRALAYVPRMKLLPAEALRLIQAAGGLAVLAHPWNATFLLPELIGEGLVGLEAYYAGYFPDRVTYLCQLARQCCLVCTGGSDFHSLELMPENRLGEVHVPAECVAALYQRKGLSRPEA